jgi:hypothetical protein
LPRQNDKNFVRVFMVVWLQKPEHFQKNGYGVFEERLAVLCAQGVVLHDMRQRGCGFVPVRGIGKIEGQ